MLAFQEHRNYNKQFQVSAFISTSISFLAHWHSEVEIICVLDGTLRMGINSEIRQLQKGDIAICSSRDIHFYDSNNTQSKCLIVLFKPEIIDCQSGWPENSHFQFPFLDKTSFQNEQDYKYVTTCLKDCMHKIYSEIDASKKGYTFIVKSHLFEISGLALRYLISTLLNNKKKHPHFYSIEKIQKVIEYLNENYMDQITLKDAANLVNFSEYHFSRLFNGIVGANFKTYLNNIRVQQAEKLIMESQSPITQIALDCGFDSIRTFNRVFKSIKGVNPTSFR